MPSPFLIFRADSGSLRIAFAAVLLLFWLERLPAENMLENSGFETGLEGWSVEPAEASAVTVTPEAVSMGKMGLRIKGGERVRLSTPTVPVKAGEIYCAVFWGRMGGTKPGLYANLVFTGEDGKEIPAINTKGFWPGTSVKNGQAFERYVMQAAAPEGATEVKIVLNSRGAGDDYNDVDDFSIERLTPEAAERKPLPPPIPVEPLLAEIASDPTRGKAPPLIVLKLDDLKDANGKVHPRWQQIADFIKTQNIKAGIGIIAQFLDGDKPEFFQWIKDRQATDNIEFWFHAWDHGGHEVYGVKANEFEKRPFEEQQKRFADAQRLAREKLGFPFTTFGPPGGGGRALFDENTVKVMREDPDMTAWLYPQPMDDAGRALEAEGKVAVLERVWCVNLEAYVGHPRFDTFLEGYAHNRGRPFFVLQGHPAGYGEDRMAEVTKIVEFLKSQGAVFVTPRECAAARKDGFSTPAGE